ncbi:MAG: hypothetical protein QG637_1112 [Chloroflexota bacterium]|nr:hypothetical protein [Chloroflexota bacterium]
MSQTRVSPALRRVVAERAHYRCSYCQTREDITGVAFTIDHIIPESLGGRTVLDNICLACWGCNLIKRNRIVGIDPRTGAVVRLFNPNTQQWHEHFAWQVDGLLVIGWSPTGRATINALQLNRTTLANARRLWITADQHPPREE